MLKIALSKFKDCIKTEKQEEKVSISANLSKTYRKNMCLHPLSFIHFTDKSMLSKIKVFPMGTTGLLNVQMGYI